MLTKNVSIWRKKLRQNFTSREALADFLLLDREELIAPKGFSINVPLRLAEKIEKGNLEDPLLKQFIPLRSEELHVEGFEKDPVGDSSFRCSNKMLKKYDGRVLLVTTSACAMHCRYCFRQNFDYEVEEKAFAQELAFIQTDESIHEVILSGGDPLSLSDERLGELLDALCAIEHVKKIRFHTRFPIGIPERLDDAFLELLQRVKKQIWFVVHVNHPNELDDEVIASLSRVRSLGIPVLNQSVLLKGVNDNVETLYELFLRLVDHGVLPYYLHQLDRVEGAQQFEVSDQVGQSLIEQLTARLPGYAVPRFVREIPGKMSKTCIERKV